LLLLFRLSGLILQGVDGDQHKLVYSSTVYDSEVDPLVEVQFIDSLNDEIRTKSLKNWSAGCDAYRESWDLCKAVQVEDVRGCAIKVWQQMAEKEMLMAISDQEKHNQWLRAAGIIRTNCWWETTASWFPSFLARHNNLFMFQNEIHILELGAYEGGSTIWFLRYLLSHPNSSLISIDTWSDQRDPASYSPTGDPLSDQVPNEITKQTFLSNIQHVTNGNKVSALATDSATGLSLLLLSSRVFSFDFIYVDASHRASEIFIDVSLAWRLLRPGGLMLLDDYQFPAARGAPQEHFAGQNQNQQYFDPDSEISFEEHNNISNCAIPIIYRLEANSTQAINTVLASIPNGAIVLHCGYQLLVQKNTSEEPYNSQAPTLLTNHNAHHILTSILSQIQ